MAAAAHLPLDEISVALEQGRPDHAERLVRAYLEQAAEDETSLTLLAISLQYQGKAGAAADVYRSLIRLMPHAASHWNNLGTALREAGQLDEAKLAYRQAQTLAPYDYDVLMNAGFLHMQCGDDASARDSFLQAHARNPATPEARIYAAKMSYATLDAELAERLIDPWRTWNQLSVDLQLELAALLIYFGHSAAGENLYQQLLRDQPDHLYAKVQLIMLYERINRIDEARALFAQLPDQAQVADIALREQIDGAHALLALRENDTTGARALLERLLQRQSSAGQGSDDGVLFQLAKACEKQGDVAATMTALAQAHAMQVTIAGRIVPDLVAADSQPLEIATKWVSAEDRHAWPLSSAPARIESPVFIVGFPRSGTTMLEQMLDAHPQLASMDERAFLQNLVERMSRFGLLYPRDLGKLTAAQCDELRDLYWTLTREVTPRPKGQRLVDKNPLNMLRLPLINRLFPEAPIILALRHPCDVILSCYMQNFRNPSFMMMCSTLDRLARGYVTAMQFWMHHAAVLNPAVMNLRYEDLLGDFAGYAQRIADFIGLDDATPLLGFHHHAREKGFIGTPSYMQVIEPPNTKAVDRWRRYYRYLEPTLSTLQPIMERFGYAD